MTPAQWDEVNRLFEDLYEKDAATRGAALRNLTDAAVRAEVESLLAHSSGAQAALESAVGGVFRAAAGAGTFDFRKLDAGTAFGHYRIVRKLGQGGMGDVYEAVRDDDFHQRVAVKIVRYGLDSEFALRRFQQERQFLASLEHPYIARLVDGGTNDDGLPYIALEFVEGTPVDEFAKQLSREQILQLFLKICEAVEYAHRRLIIHRDLKPANILVTTDGVPKLLDFGIAKLADATSTDATRTQFQALTPQYASPEQIRNEAVTTATDVYSLGLILHELLCGRRAYNIESTTSLVEAHRIITEFEPSRPGLSDDLDNILLMALRKDAARRYQSVREFAADITRSLEDQPVMARPDTIRYRTTKFIRRHRLPVAAMAVAALAIIGGVGVSLYQANLARQRFELVRKLAHTFVFDIHDEVAKVDGTTAARELVVKTALEYLDQLSQSAGNDMTLREELAAAYVKVANAQGIPGAPNLGHTAEAIRNYEKAAQLYESLAAARPDKKAALARFYLQYAAVRHLSGDPLSAEATVIKATDILEPLATKDGAPLQAQLDYINAISLLGDLRSDAKGRGENPSELLLDKAAKLMDALLVREPSREARMLAIQVHSRRSNLSAVGRLSEALESLTKQEKLADEILAVEKTNPQLRRARAVVAQDKSVIYFDDFGPSLNDPVNALHEARRYLEMARVAAAADTKNIAAQFSASIALSRVAVSERFSAPAVAVAKAREALASLEALQAAKPAFLNLSRIPRIRRILAEALVANHNPHEGAEAARLAVAEQRELLAAKPTEDSLIFYMIATLFTAGEAELAAGNTAAAHTALEEARTRLESDKKQLDSALILLNTYDKVLRTQAAVRRAQGDAAAAAGLEARAARIWTDYPGNNEFVTLQRARRR